MSLIEQLTKDNERVKVGNGYMLCISSENLFGFWTIELLEMTYFFMHSKDIIFVCNMKEIFREDHLQKFYHILKISLVFHVDLW